MYAPAGRPHEHGGSSDLNPSSAYPSDPYQQQLAQQPGTYYGAAAQPAYTYGAQAQQPAVMGMPAAVPVGAFESSIKGVLFAYAWMDGGLEIYGCICCICMAGSIRPTRRYSHYNRLRHQRAQAPGKHGGRYGWWRRRR